MLKIFLRYIFPLSFWTYVFIKLFIFDLDIYLAEAISPELVGILKYKFLLIIACTSFLILKVNKKTLLKETAYLLSFPLILIFWYPIIALFHTGNLNLVIGCIDGLMSMYASFKYSVVTISLFIISLVAIFSSQNTIILYGSISIIIVLLFGAFIRRMYFIFRPTGLFTLTKKFFSIIRDHSTKTFILQEDLKSVEVVNMSEEQLKKWTETLQTSVIFNRGLLFTAKKLKDYQKSGLNLIAYIVTVFSLIALTVFSFSAINYALYKVDSASFLASKAPDFFTFFYYSFNNFVFNSIQEITPSSMISQSILMLEQFFVAFLFANIVSLVFSFRSQRYTEELEEIIEDMKIESGKIELVIRTDYNFPTIEDAISELEKLKSSSISVIIALSNGLK